MRFILFILMTSSFYSFSQKEYIEDFIGQALALEMPTNFEYCYVISNSIEHLSIENEIQNYQKNELYWRDKDFPFHLLSLKNTPSISWTNYRFKKAFVFPLRYSESKPPISKYVSFSKNPNTTKMDSLNNNDLHTLYIQRRIFRGKTKRWEAIKAAWKNDDKVNPEKNMYFSISYPIFSKDNKYALLTISKMRRCNGNIQTVLYENHNNKWEKLYKFDQGHFVISTSHVNCGDIIVWERPKFY